jgi:hypothetical protein
VAIACFCGCGRTISRFRPYRRTANNYGETARMLVGWLSYGQRIDPDENPGPVNAFVAIGEKWLNMFAAVAHGSTSLAGVSRDDWVRWRDTAMTGVLALRADHDPTDTIFRSWADKHELNMAALGGYLLDHPHADPLSFKPVFPR